MAASASSGEAELVALERWHGRAEASLSGDTLHNVINGGTFSGITIQGKVNGGVHQHQYQPQQAPAPTNGTQQPG